MKNKKGFLILVTGAFVVLSGAALFYLFFNKTEVLASETEIRGLVESQYSGSIITSMEQKEDTYEVFMENDMGEYLVKVDGRTREITSLKLVNRKEEAGGGEPDSEKQEPKEEPDGDQPEAPDEPAKEEPAPSMLTRDEAIEIALKEVPGKVEDVEIDEENGVKVYEVEIEMDDDSEATIILNAYTGEIISLTWD
ncbi:PepSY domain-containing protein [Bacillus sp. LL01]|uniref:PepSY domain-containing protein n=1 Tax=Bacillus sp. LL01 TaxID=1665556 RepID=UPI00069E5503|nr:PepSY domain-containing protein [Bacillus sp. LL01]